MSIEKIDNEQYRAKLTIPSLKYKYLDIEMIEAYDELDAVLSRCLSKTLNLELYGYNVMGDYIKVVNENKQPQEYASIIITDIVKLVFKNQESDTIENIEVFLIFKIMNNEKGDALKINIDNNKKTALSPITALEHKHIGHKRVIRHWIDIFAIGVNLKAK